MKNITVFTIVITALMSAPTGVSNRQERDRRRPDLALADKMNKRGFGR